MQAAIYRTISHSHTPVFCTGEVSSTSDILSEADRVRKLGVIKCTHTVRRHAERAGSAARFVIIHEHQVERSSSRWPGDASKGRRQRRSRRRWPRRPVGRPQRLARSGRSDGNRRAARGSLHPATKKIARPGAQASGSRVAESRETTHARHAPRAHSLQRAPSRGRRAREEAMGLVRRTAERPWHAERRVYP